MTWRQAARRVAMHPMVNRPATTGLHRVGERVPRIAGWAQRRLPRVGTARVRLADGGVLTLEGGSSPDWVTHRSFWHGLDHYEPEALPVFASLARDAKLIVDAGANIGLFSLLAARANPTARIFAFEPAPEVFAALQRNVGLNGASRVVCVRAALGDETGMTGIFTPIGKVDTIGSAQIGHRVGWTEGPWQCEYVPVVGLDTFWATHNLPPLDLLKVDVEGAEEQVLAGARGIIAKHRPDIVCELLETASGSEAAALLRDMLTPLGYRAYVLTPDGPVPQLRIEPGSHWNHLLSPCQPAELNARLAG
jgi:FkbM family methyltransferase